MEEFTIIEYVSYSYGIKINASSQKEALEMYCKAHTTLQPQWRIAGHYHFAAKACPSFDVEEWLEEIGINKKNIYTKKPTVL